MRASRGRDFVGLVQYIRERAAGFLRGGDVLAPMAPTNSGTLTVEGQRFLALAEATGDLVVRHDADGQVVDARHNSDGRLAAEDLLGRGLFEHVHVADRPQFGQALASARDAGKTVTARFRLDMRGPRDRGEPRFVWVEMRSRGLDEGGGALVSLIRDMSAAMTSQDEVERARAEAIRANTWKDRLIANVSHELRTPLNAIIGFSELLGNSEFAPTDPARQREYASIIHASSAHLLSIVNTILDVSKIEAGQFDIAPEAFDVEPLIDACCNMMRLKAQEGGIELARSPLDRPVEILADQRACRQILLNLLSNAIKFTPPGGTVTVEARRDGAYLTLSVADTGIGIAAEHLPRLGDPFYQVRAAYDRPYEGTGLGLSMVCGLVGLHGGAVALESAAEQGVKVIVRLPLDCRDTLRPDAAPVRIETRPRVAPAPANPPDPQPVLDPEPAHEKKFA
jgi:cell cycle sensor histidine kinase DivJ